MSDTKFKVGDKVERLHEGDVWYTAKVTRFYEDDDTSCQVRVVDPGTRTNVRKGERLYPLLENLRLVKPKKVRIQQLKDDLAYNIMVGKDAMARLEEAEQDVANLQCRLNEANRRYGKASKTIGELRGRLAQRALLAMAEPEEAPFKIGHVWLKGDPEPDLPVGSEVTDVDGDVIVKYDGYWKLATGELQRQWCGRSSPRPITTFAPLTLTKIGGG